MEQTRQIKVEPGSRAELDELIAHYDTALLTTRSGDDTLHTRPMAMQKKHEPGEDLWFVSWSDSQKIRDLESDSRCGVTLYGGQHDSDYVSLSGRCEIIRDKALIKKMWEPAWKAWFPEGPEAEDVCLLHFIPEFAEYLRTPGGKVKVVAESVKALVTKKTPQPAPKRELNLEGLRATAWDS